MANVREGGQATIADLQSKYDLLVAQNEALLNRFERLAEVQKASGAVQRISDLPSGVANDRRVSEFLEGSPRPFTFYSEARNFQIVLQYGQFLGIDVTTGRNMRNEDLIIRFIPFNGVGSEIPDPDDKRKRKFNWGILHVESVPEVVAGKISAADLVEKLQDTNAYKATGTIFDDEEARARLRIEYDIMKAVASEQARRAKAQASRPAGAKKGGGLALAGIPDLD